MALGSLSRLTVRYWAVRAEMNCLIRGSIFHILHYIVQDRREIPSI
jgi:hypothetical protein